MEVIEYLQKYHGADLSKESPIFIPMGRFKDIPKMFRRLGFKKGAEIGVHEGSYSRALLKGVPGLRLTLVDLWESYPGYKDFGKHNLYEAYNKTLTNTKGFDIRIIKDWSDKAADQVEDGSLDFIFIDGNHAYEWVVWDMYKWIPKVRKGGVIYGHDYDDYSNRGRWKTMNVMNAVDGWMKSYKIKPWFVTTNNRNRCWMYVKD